MKKIISVCLLFSIIVIVLSSCRHGELKIENYEWQLRQATYVENGSAIPLAEDGSLGKAETPIVDVVLKASNGVLTITDKTNNKTYNGSYVKDKITPKSIDYKVVIDGKEGYATVAMTTYHDGREEPTLPINLGKYSLYFYEVQK